MQLNNKNNYLLMNKDNIVASFKRTENTFGDDIIYEIINCSKSKLPIGFMDITTWIDGRKASKHNSHLKEIMERLECADSEGFIRVTHATSINDTFWVKREDETVSWNDISLYCNEFTESISALALEGVGLYNEPFSSTGLPEFVSDGSFPKCFKKEKDGIYIYKGGARGASNVGLEPYSEVLAAEIATHLTDNAISYKLAKLHGRLASKCKLFTNEKYGYVPFRRLAEQGKVVTLDAAFRYFENIGSEKTFREMLLIDALTFNTDRHTGNYGVLFNNNTLDVIKMAPVFDLNLSLFPYWVNEDFKTPGDNILKYGPALGNDFTRLGQQSFIPEFSDKLRDFCDWQFSFKGNNTFSNDRVKCLEEIVSKQAKAILSKEKLQTKNVFIPETADKVKIAVKDMTEEMEKFAEKIEDLNLPILISFDADSHRAVVLVEPENPKPCDFLFEFDFLADENRIYINFNKISVEDLANYNLHAYNIFNKINDIFTEMELEQIENEERE